MYDIKWSSVENVFFDRSTAAETHKSAARQLEKTAKDEAEEGPWIGRERGDLVTFCMHQKSSNNCNRRNGIEFEALEDNMCGGRHGWEDVSADHLHPEWISQGICANGEIEWFFVCLIKIKNKINVPLILKSRRSRFSSINSFSSPSRCRSLIITRATSEWRARITISRYGILQVKRTTRG